MSLLEGFWETEVGKIWFAAITEHCNALKEVEETIFTLEELIEMQENKEDHSLRESIFIIRLRREVAKLKVAYTTCISSVDRVYKDIKNLENDE